MPRPVDLHRGHERIGKQHGPGQGVTELGASLRVGRDSAGIVIRGAGDKAWTKDSEQSGFGRLHNGARTEIGALSNAISSPHRSGRRLAQEQDENDERNWNSDEPKQNRHLPSPIV
jgi:hypothetical protein